MLRGLNPCFRGLLVSDLLQKVNFYSLTILCLNPCFRGLLVSDDQLSAILERVGKCLNPCFRGLLVSDVPQARRFLSIDSVLILVFVDYWFLTNHKSKWKLRLKKCLNPCFRGLLVSDVNKQTRELTSEESLNPCFRGLLVSDGLAYGL